MVLHVGLCLLPTNQKNTSKTRSERWKNQCHKHVFFLHRLFHVLGSILEGSGPPGRSPVGPKRLQNLVWVWSGCGLLTLLRALNFLSSTSFVYYSLQHWFWKGLGRSRAGFGGFGDDLFTIFERFGQGRSKKTVSQISPLHTKICDTLVKILGCGMDTLEGTLRFAILIL